MVPPFVKSLIENRKFPILANFIIALVSLVVIYTSGNKMLQMDLWAYQPLYFFTAFWFLFSVIFHFIGKKSRSSIYWGLSILSGYLLYLSFPDPSITPLIFIGFLPILYIAEEERSQKNGAWRVFRYSYSAFLLWNILTTFWVTNTSFMPSVVAYTLNSLFMTIPIIFYFHVRKRFGMTLSLVAFIAFWLSFEMIHLRWEISWPWLTLGNAFSSRSLWIQWYEYTGHLGGSLWVLMMNALIFHVIMKIRENKKMQVTSLLYPMLGLVIPMFLSFFIFFGYQEKGEWVNVTVIQPNFEPHYEKFDIPQNRQLNRFVELTKNHITDSTDYIVFPETSFNFFDIENLNSAQIIQQLKTLVDSLPDANLVTGLVTYQMFQNKESGIESLREINRDGETKYMQIQNSAAQFHSRDAEYQFHIKGRLVPGAEIFPYSRLLFFLEPIVKQAGGTTAGHGRSKQPTVFQGTNANVGAAICYESIYGYWMAKFVEQGADLLFVITNDGWWDNTPGHRQHLAFSILRAIELRKSIARSANTGVSCIIDQHGRVFNTLPYGEEGAIQARMQANPEQTFYARNGDIAGRISYLLSIIFIVFLFGEKIHPKRKNSRSLTDAQDVS